MTNRPTTLTVLGAGFAGLATAQRAEQLGAQCEIFESRSYLGGHASSMSKQGFTFDEGPHVSFSKIPEVVELLDKGIQGRFREFSSTVSNYYQGHWVTHPAQVNLFGLPADLVTRCVVDIVNAAFKSKEIPDNYAEWLLAQFGETFSHEFPFRYTRKYWTVEPEKMTTDWIGPRMYMPKLEEVIRGAVGPREENLHYITSFRYPTHGGFGEYSKALSSNAKVHLGTPVEWIDPKSKEIGVRSGKTYGYERLISSLPLPDLMRLIKDSPAVVRDAASNLTCTSLYLVDVGVKRNEGFPNGDWLYFYDEDICFARVSFPHRLAASNVPEGHGSIQAEIYHSRYRPIEYENVLTRGIEDMIKTGLLRKDDDIVFSQVRNIQYGNILFDQLRKNSLKIVETYLDTLGILRCGRYGLWNYHWTDESIVSGWQAAEAALNVK